MTLSALTLLTILAGTAALSTVERVGQDLAQYSGAFRSLGLSLAQKKAHKLLRRNNKQNKHVPKKLSSVSSTTTSTTSYVFVEQFTSSDCSETVQYYTYIKADTCLSTYYAFDATSPYTVSYTCQDGIASATYYSDSDCSTVVSTDTFSATCESQGDGTFTGRKVSCVDSSELFEGKSSYYLETDYDTECEGEATLLNAIQEGFCFVFDGYSISLYDPSFYIYIGSESCSESEATSFFTQVATVDSCTFNEDDEWCHTDDDASCSAISYYYTSEFVGSSATATPSVRPSRAPTRPTRMPTAKPSTRVPSKRPTIKPTPTRPTRRPTTQK